jgi:hypothetical protein
MFAGSWQTKTSFHNLSSLLPDLYFIGMSILLIMVICLILNTLFERVFIIGILLLGFVTKMILSFSPTVYASGSRTSMLFVFCIFFVCLYLIKKIHIMCNGKNHYTKS